MDDPEPMPSPPPAPAAPAARNLGQETRDTLQAQIDLAPQLYASEAQYQPLYSALQSRNWQQQMLGTPASGDQPAVKGLLDFYQQDLYPRASGMLQQANTASRAADISDVAALGPSATAAFRAANPEATATLAELQRQAMSAGPSELERLLEQQARSEMALGSQMSPEQQRQIEQATRASFAARGMALGKPAAFAEVLNKDQYATQRQGQRQQFAMGVDQLMQQRQQANRGFLGNVTQLSLGATQDPFLAILGRASQAPQVGQAQFGSGQSLLGAQPNLFNPQSSYAQDLYNTNYNGQAAYGIGMANRDAALYGAQLGYNGNIYGANQAFNGAVIGGAMSMIGSMAGGAGAAAGGGAFCWVAREVYGESDPRWLLFREWLLTRAPRWFRELYARQGARFALWIQNKPILKRVIRAWMDARIETLKPVEA